MLPKKFGRELLFIEEVETRIAARQARERQNGQIVKGPWGHDCAVCGLRVLPGHPLHLAERPERSEPRRIR